MIQIILNSVNWQLARGILYCLACYLNVGLNRVSLVQVRCVISLSPSSDEDEGSRHPGGCVGKKQPLTHSYFNTFKPASHGNQELIVSGEIGWRGTCQHLNKKHRVHCQNMAVPGEGQPSVCLGETQTTQVTCFTA